MPHDQVERRRGRRVMLGAPLVLRREHPTGATTPQVHAAKNVSLAGVYFEVDGEAPYALNDVVLASVSVPELHRREFPFTRLSGKSRVVRVMELQAPERGRKQFGIAIEFGDDVTALTALPARG